MRTFPLQPARNPTRRMSPDRFIHRETHAAVLAILRHVARSILDARFYWGSTRATACRNTTSTNWSYWVPTSSLNLRLRGLHALLETRADDSFGIRQASTQAVQFAARASRVGYPSNDRPGRTCQRYAPDAGDHRLMTRLDRCTKVHEPLAHRSHHRRRPERTANVSESDRHEDYACDLEDLSAYRIDRKACP